MSFPGKFMPQLSQKLGKLQSSNMAIKWKLSECIMKLRVRLIALILPFCIYSRLSLSRSRRDPLKHFEISVPRHIRCAELRIIPIKKTNFTFEHVIWLLKFEIYVEILWKRGEIAPGEQFLLLSTIFCYLMLDLYVKTRIRFSLRDKRLLEITEVEITRVDYIFLACKLEKIVL